MVMLRVHVCVLFCVSLMRGIVGLPGDAPRSFDTMRHIIIYASGTSDSMGEMMSRSPVPMAPNTASFGVPLRQQSSCIAMCDVIFCQMQQVSSLKALPASRLQMEFSSKTSWTQCTACLILCCCAVACALLVAPGFQVKILAIVTETIFARRGETSSAQAISLFLVYLRVSWVNVGPIKGGSTEYCHAGSQYSLLGCTNIH